MKNSWKIFRQGIAAAAIFLAAMPSLLAQAQVTVSGHVYDELHQPMIGVGVMQQGTTHGVATDLDGAYSITVPAGATIVYSSIGYVDQTFRAPAGGGAHDVNLEPDNEMIEETVVVGYGVQKKSVVTGSISSVKAEDMMISSNTRPEQALQGKTSGVQVISSSGAPGSELKIRVRGYSSNGNADPLYIVDGLRTTDISTLEPSNIESMEVLKDGASAAIYGAEGGNGVILITTKRGREGQTQVEYNLQYTVQRLGKTPKVLNANDYLTYMKEGGAIASTVTATGVDTDWIDATFESSPMVKHNLSISGASDRYSYLGSLSYLNQEGIVVGDQDNYKRFSGMFNGSIQAKKWLKFSSNIQVNRATTTSFNMNDGSRGVIANALMLDPLTPVVYDNSNLPASIQARLNAGQNLMRDENGQIYGISDYVTGECINPLVQRTLNQPKTTRTSFVGNVQADITPFKGFTFTSKLGTMFNQMNLHIYHPGFFYNEEMKNDNPSLDERDYTTTYYQWENYANYLKSWGEHNFTFMLGTALSERHWKSVTASGYPLLKDQESYADLSYVASQAGSNVGGSQVTDHKASFFGRINYDYAGKYLFEATVRRDGAGLSILPKDKRWGTFPAFSLGWVATQEDWFPKTAWVNYLKIRGSWGQNGSLSNLGNYSYAANIAASGSRLSYLIWSMINVSYLYPLADGSWANAAYPSSLGNYSLTWETSEQTDIGLDVRLFGSRLTFTADYYIKKTKDLITTNTPALEAGNAASPINGGNVENKGLDLEAGWRDHIGDFTYGINGNISFLKNKVTYLDPSLSRLNGVGLMQWTGATAFEVGHPVWYFRGYKTAGVDPSTGDLIIVDVNNDGEINSNDYTDIGSAIPKFTYGLTLNAGWKGIDLTVFMAGSYGNKILYGARRPDRITTNKLQTLYDGRWTEGRTDAKYPSAYWQLNNTNFWNSDKMVFDGSYLKIKQIQIGYTFPKTLTEQVKISNLRAYISIDNYFTFTKYPGMDPEASSTDNNGIGVDQGFFPNAKNMMFGLSLTF